MTADYDYLYADHGGFYVRVPDGTPASRDRAAAVIARAAEGIDEDEAPKTVAWLSTQAKPCVMYAHVKSPEDIGCGCDDEWESRWCMDADGEQANFWDFTRAALDEAVLRAIDETHS